MKIRYYKIIGKTCDSEGKYNCPKVLARFKKLEDAKTFKKDWEKLWQKHTENQECISPCWYDFKKDLEIELRVIEIRDYYSGLNLDIDYDSYEELYEQLFYNMKF